MGRRGTPVRFGLIALAVCALASDGCHWSHLPRIDPSGERIFIHGPPPLQPPAAPARPPVFVEQPGPPRPHHHTGGVAVMPCKIIAPVGSEVVMLAAVAGLDGQPKANQRVEWMLAPGGVGQIVAPGGRMPLDWLVGFRTWPRKVDNSYAIGSTSSRNLCLTRGTPSPADDVPVLRGQAWLSVTSPVEGTSFVTAYAPSVYGWDSRRQTATIHWIDAQWTLPPPAVQTVGGRHVLTTTVLRHSTQAPAEGWRVRYEIVSGPAAGFAPQGAQLVDVTTNALGQAAVEIFQTEPAAGANVVGIEITRPAGMDSEQTFVVGRGTTQISWTPPTPAPSPPPVSTGPPAPAPGAAATAPVLEARMTGPERAVVGQEVTFEVLVANRGGTGATGLVIVDRYPPGLEHAQPGNSIERALGDLAPGESRTVAVTFRVASPGRLCNRAEIHSPWGVLAQAEACVTAGQAAEADAAAQPRLSVRKTGPSRRRVGETAEFLIEVTNSGRQAATELKVLDHYDQDSLDPVSATDGYGWTGLDLVWNVDVLPPGKTIIFQVHCRCLKPSARSCNGVTVTSREQARADGESCLEIVPVAGAGRTALSVSVADVRDPVAVGNQTTYEIRVTNNSQAVDRQVAVAVTVPAGMAPLVVGSSGPAAYRVEGRQVRFDPVREIRPGETLSYRVEARAERAGIGRCQVELTSEQARQPLTAETTTTVVSRP